MRRYILPVLFLSSFLTSGYTQDANKLPGNPTLPSRERPGSRGKLQSPTGLSGLKRTPARPTLS